MRHGSEKAVCGGGHRCPAGGGRPGAGTGRLCGGRSRAGCTGRLYPAASAAGCGPHPAGRAAAGRKARCGGTGRQALSSGKDHRTGSGRGAGGLLCPTGADGVQCHPYGGGLHWHPAGRAHPYPVGHKPSAAGLWPGGAGAGGAAGGTGGKCDCLCPARRTACAGREPWSAGCRACPAGRAGSGL